MNDPLTLELFAHADEKNADFTAKLNPVIPRENILGVRFPDINSIAKTFSGTPEAAVFMEALPHRYLDQNNLHAALISRIKDPAACIAAIDRFLPYIDNWSTCDAIKPKSMRKELPALRRAAERWIASGKTYAVRLGAVTFMSFFLDGAFDPEISELVASVGSEEYYVNMGRAWYFATALAKQYEATLPFFENGRLDLWTHNKSIQKAVESYRVTDEHKRYLRSLKR